MEAERDVRWYSASDDNGITYTIVASRERTPTFGPWEYRTDDGRRVTRDGTRYIIHPDGIEVTSSASNQPDD